jgi:hypothetical protein
MVRAVADSGDSANKPAQPRLINPRTPQTMRFPVRVKARVWGAAKAVRAVAVLGLADGAVADKAREVAATANWQIVFWPLYDNSSFQLPQQRQLDYHGEDF